MNQRLEKIIESYGKYHTQEITKYTHFIGVPMIVFSLLLLFSWMHFEIRPLLHLSLMWVVIAISGIYYLSLDLKLGGVLVIVFILMGLIAALITHYSYTKGGGITFLVMFILGWIIQFIGHYFEEQKPAFLDNILQVFAAPIFVTYEVFELFKKE